MHLTVSFFTHTHQYSSTFKKKKKKRVRSLELDNGTRTANTSLIGALIGIKGHVVLKHWIDIRTESHTQWH